MPVSNDEYWFSDILDEFAFPDSEDELEELRDLCGNLSELEEKSNKTLDDKREIAILKQEKREIEKKLKERTTRPGQNKLLYDALENGRGLTETLEEFKKYKRRPLYSRNPYECVAIHCLKCNETPNAYTKYNWETFQSLYDECIKGLGRRVGEGVSPIAYVRKENQSSDKKQSDSEIITLGALRKYLVDNAEVDSEDGHSIFDIITGGITIDFSEELNGIDLTRPDAKETFITFFKEHTAQLSNAVQSMRYYFVKYIYYLACHQILELKDLLLEMSNYSPDEYARKIRGKKQGNGLHTVSLTIRDGLLDDLSKENDSRKQKDKLLLHAALKNFILTGKSTSDSYFKILDSNTAQISTLYNNKGGLIFSNAKRQTEIENNRDSVHDAEKIIAKNNLAVQEFNRKLQELENSADSSPNRQGAIDGLKAKIIKLEKQTIKKKEKIKKLKERRAEVLEWIEQHNRLVEMLSSTKVEDFFGYGVDLNKIYDILFERVFNLDGSFESATLKNRIEKIKRKIKNSIKKENVKTPITSLERKELEDSIRKRIVKEIRDIKASYIRKMIDGQYTMTRQAFLTSLSSIKGAMYLIDDYIKDEREEELTYKAILDITRIDAILDRISFYNLTEAVGDETEPEGTDPNSCNDSNYYDRIYFKIFSAKACEVGNIINAWATAIQGYLAETEISIEIFPAIPQITPISAKKQKNLKRKYKNG